jgi:hypothetical protein
MIERLWDKRIERLRAGMGDDIDARLCVEAIRSVASDPEAAHCREDELHRAVLEGIASGRYVGCGPAVLARIAFSTVEIDFPRWCA